MRAMVRASRKVTRNPLPDFMKWWAVGAGGFVASALLVGAGVAAFAIVPLFFNRPQPQTYRGFTYIVADNCNALGSKYGGFCYNITDSKWPSEAMSSAGGGGSMATAEIANLAAQQVIDAYVDHGTLPS